MNGSFTSSPAISSTALYQKASIRRIESAAGDKSLMQRAGAATAEWAARLTKDNGRPMLFLAGPGNNGGDAIDAATRLMQQGFEVCVVSLGTPEIVQRQQREATAAHARFIAGGGKYLHTIPNRQPWGLIVDGLFGIGLARDLDADAGQWITAANTLAKEHACPLLALDCPSGLDADTGRIHGTAIRATHTLTFIGLKPGLFTFDGPDHCGEIRLATLGLTHSEMLTPDGLCANPALFAAQLQPRFLNSHKGTFGNVFIIGGGQSMVGAALLAGRATLKSGAGRVYVGLADPSPSAPAVDFIQPELMLKSAEALLSQLAPPSVLVCGPGLGQSSHALALLKQALLCKAPVLLDADALNLLAGQIELASIIQQRKEPTLMTPHPLEAARLLACPVSQILEDRIGAACKIARLFDAFVALKGCGTIIANPNGIWRLNRSGNPALACAGSGDVLCGQIAALIAQGWPTFEALTAAVHLHGLAADEWRARMGGMIGMTAGEIIEPARQILNNWIAGASATTDNSPS